ncbi:MAG TPA: DUF1156 domain-containing protein [Armatimonadota bacterium]|nr:DUF1156 domain-containing protein [Armatimonadota bacterium]
MLSTGGSGARREKSIRHGHISTLHIWWTRRPLAMCSAVIYGALWPGPADSDLPPGVPGRRRSSSTHPCVRSSAQCDPPHRAIHSAAKVPPRFSAAKFSYVRARALRAGISCAIIAVPKLEWWPSG